MAPTTTASSSPKGLALSKLHAIGNKIGEGAFGEVYALKGSASSTKWAAKVVPIPTKITKKRNSPAEVAVGRLHYEFLAYSNCRELSGSLLPLLPSPLKDKIDLYYDNLSGFRCLVMEHLSSTLVDALTPLVDSSSRFIELGKTASKFIDILEGMHQKKYLIVDIKPDNFMVASLAAKVTDTSLAKALRLIDLGLVRSFSSVGGHSNNDGLKGLVGNALYASLHVHALNTPSRRDDLQSVLFVIAEIVLQTQALDKGTAPPYGAGNLASHLPWSQEASDDLVGKEKERQVLHRDSPFFQAMPREAADIMFDCIKVVNEYPYKQKPDYDALRASLSALKVPRTSNAKPASRKSNKGESVKSPPTRKSPRRQLKDVVLPKADDDVDTPTVSSKRSSKSARMRPMYDEDDDVIMDDVIATDDEVEINGNVENEETNVVNLAAVNGFGLCFEKEDLWIVLSEQTNSMEVVLGRQPISKSATFTLDDESLDACHVTLSIPSNIKHAVHVKPLNKNCLVSVNSGRVPASGTCAFSGQKVGIGKRSFKVVSLPVKTAKSIAYRGMSRIARHDSPTVRARRVFVEIIVGSFKGNQYELKPGVRDAIVIGRKPSGQGFPVALDDTGVVENHLRLELHQDKRSNQTLVRAIDLGSPSGLDVNDEIVIEDVVSLMDDAVIKLSDHAAISVTFTD